VVVVCYELSVVVVCYEYSVVVVLRIECGSCVTNIVW
jgi:hypothetical protein